MALAEIEAYKRLPLAVVGAKDCELVLADGRRVLDLYGGHCVNTLGAGDPALATRMREQWERLSFVTNLLDHAPRTELLAALEPTMPPGDWRVFCSNSGAEANENALKMTLAATGRDTVIVFDGAFHGRTAAASAASDVKRTGFPSAPFEVRRLPFGALDTTPLDESVAAVLLEPIQSMAGVSAPPAGFLEAWRRACTDRGALLVFDEVQTGNGRLGTFWASQYYGCVPDLFTTAKGAACGFPIGLTFASEAVAGRFPAGLCGSTFGGGPLALAAATEVARRIAQPGFLESVARTSAALRDAALRGPVAQVRGAGLLLGCVLHEGWTAAGVRDALLEQGVLVATTNDPQVMRLMPPLTLQKAHVERFAVALDSLAVPAQEVRA